VPPSPASDGSGPAASAYPIAGILKWLLEQHGGTNGLPAWNDPHLKSKLESLTSLSRNTVADLLKERRRKEPPRKDTCRSLAEVFRRAIPAIGWEWFRVSSVAELERLVEASAGDGQTISITVPRKSACPLDVLRAKLPGTYVTYRYSIDRSQIRHVAREVIEITERTDQFRFRMSFRTGGHGEEDGTLMWFEGIVLPVGWSLCFTGWETERLRSLFFHWARHSPNTPYHLGMLNSTKREHPYYPIAACTLMIKVEAGPSEKEKERYFEEATRIASFDKIIEEDFGPDALDPIGVFLSNSINTIRADGNALVEAVLRINEDRFEARMRDIYQQALLRGRAPFVRDWKQRSVRPPLRRGSNVPQVGA
jgi:hypothetical protein